MRKKRDAQASHTRLGSSSAQANMPNKPSSEGESKADLPYDDDPEWNASFEKSLPALEKLAAKALKNYREGRTVDLNPDEL